MMRGLEMLDRGTQQQQNGSASATTPRVFMVAVDGSEWSVRALDMARRMARASDRIDLLHVTPALPAALGARVVAEATAESAARAATVIAEARAKLGRRADVVVTEAVRSGSVVDQIVRRAEEVAATCVMIGEPEGRDRSGAHSTIDSVVSHCSRPVLVARAS